MADDSKNDVALAQERNILASERTRLAAERTVSAWIRTALASAGGGFAIIRLIAFETPNHRLLANWIGQILIILGVVIFVLALLDYFDSCKKLPYTINKRNQWWVSLVTFFFIIAALLLLSITFI